MKPCRVRPLSALEELKNAITVEPPLSVRQEQEVKVRLPQEGLL